MLVFVVVRGKCYLIFQLMSQLIITIAPTPASSKSGGKRKIWKGGCMACKSIHFPPVVMIMASWASSTQQADGRAGAAKWAEL